MTNVTELMFEERYEQLSSLKRYSGISRRVGHSNSIDVSEVVLKYKSDKLQNKCIERMCSVSVYGL